MSYKIEDLIQIPPIQKGRVTAFTIALRDMEVGQSILVNDIKKTCLSSSLCRFAKQNSRKYATRIVEGGIRVWRLE